jgi:hypothetical protein
MAGLVSGGSFNAQRQGSSCGLGILGCEAGMEGVKAASVKAQSGVELGRSGQNTNSDLL